jgi:hypothetical protein
LVTIPRSATTITVFSPKRTEHRIEQPQRVLLATGEPPPLEVTYDIVDGEEHQWLIRLERPPALPGE